MGEGRWQQERVTVVCVCVCVCLCPWVSVFVCMCLKLQTCPNVHHHHHVATPRTFWEACSQNIGTLPRVMTNETTWSCSTMTCSVSTKFAALPSSSTPRALNRVPAR